MKVSEMTLDELLSRYGAVTEQDEAAAACIAARLNGPLPRQKRPFWRMPAALLDWQFAPAWPRLAALAGCAVIGFSIGIVGVDRSFAQPEPQIATRDIGTMVFGLEFGGPRQ